MTHGHWTTAAQAVIGAVLSRRAALSLLVALPLLLLTLLAAPAAEAGQTMFGGEDWYVTAAGLVGIENAGVSGGSPSGGAVISAGFRFNRWFSTEVGAEWAHRFHYDQGTGPVSCTGPGGGESSRFNAWQVTAGGRLYFSEGQVQPFLLAHGGFIETRDSGGGRTCMGTGFVNRLGGGVEVFVTNGLALSLIGAYVLPVGGKAEGHDYVSIGLGITWY